MLSTRRHAPALHQKYMNCRTTNGTTTGGSVKAQRLPFWTNRSTYMKFISAHGKSTKTAISCLTAKWRTN